MNKILTQAAEIPSLRTNPTYKKGRPKPKKVHKPWFTQDLARLRNELKKSGQVLFKNPNDKYLRELCFHLKRRFKFWVLQNKRKFKQDLYNKLENFQSTNPKEYWELFDEFKRSQNTYSDDNSCPIDDSEWIGHHTKLLGAKPYEQIKLDKIRSQIDALGMN